MTAALIAAKEERPGRIIEIAIHQYDSMEAPESTALVTLFEASSFPLLVFDMDINTKLQEQSTKAITDYVDKTVAFIAGGIAIDATSKETLTVTIKNLKREIIRYL